MGSGDWNDGMNKVGDEGKGESVWMGFFLYDVLVKFAEIARLKDDTSFADLCGKEAAQLQRNIEKEGWDGGWYRRAYSDEGSLLGSNTCTECRIDSVAQSWSVLSGAGEPARARLAMSAVDQMLVHRDKKLVQLLDPPFDKSETEPGYIKGYVPGVRENGGQYTHAAIWVAMAFAALGERKRAWDVMDIVNPINHTKSPEDVEIYKVEPYVVSSDIYAVAPHVGRGGWTWFTGAAAWMYRLIVESLMGLSLKNGKLSFAPCLPEAWNEIKIHYRYGETPYHIVIRQTAGKTDHIVMTLDGLIISDAEITLVDDQKEHVVDVVIPAVSDKS
jgi:cellobiose phosphorylase